MKITARLDETTVKQLLSELLPARVLLDADDVPPGAVAAAAVAAASSAESTRWIQIEPARQVDFVAGEGLRIEVNGQLQWSAAGVPLPMTFNSAQLMLRPAVVVDDTGGRLIFHPSLEALDLKNVPGFVDSGVLGFVNKRLGAQGDALAWHFSKTLALQFPLPATLVPLDKFQLAASVGEVEVLADAIVFSITFVLAFSRRRG